MEMQNVKDQVKSVFTPAHIKKAAALAVLIGIVSAGGAYYHHSQAEARSAMEKQARSEMIAAQASQRSVVLIDESHVRTIAAESIGKSEAELDFRSVYLTMWDHDDRDGKHDGKRKHDRKHGRDDRRDRGRHEMMAPQPTAPAAPADANGNAAAVPPMGTAPAQAAPPAQPTPNMGQSDFRPVYKVKCYAGNVEYKLYIDAVTGTVLSSKVDVDDDFFDKHF
ncbi:hypothetical protein HMPREF9081_0909 [Centipeda periodontii DSM 2778]|uniref:PepSY domain-containing protein n=1 Tax=Centipeda periodontii DSM 2778 TaxID=888060 RepID=F5RKX4_9FIRM|nr:PepSY domain-containing protein [Centipeda periodontii]EGK60799.1 hypothetical protein HMPREF9081_0909 [Centipeda periodontii DSM 2778]